MDREKLGRKRSPSLTVVQCYKLTIRRIVVDVNILYLLSVNTYSPCLCSRLFPSMESGHNSYVFLCTFRSEGPPIIFFFLFSFFSFIRSFFSFNVIATPLSRFVSRIKTFVKSRSIRESDSYVFDEEIIIYSNKLQLERTSPFLPPLSFFIEFLKQTRDRRNMRIVKSS